MMVLSLGIDRARVTLVMNRASIGTERRIWCRNAVLQFGRFGCKRAHDRLVMAGCAGPVIGEMDDTEDGKMLGSLGCRIGETKALCKTLSACTLCQVWMNSRPAETRNRRQRIHNLLFLGPSNMIRKRLGSALDITG